MVRHGDHHDAGRRVADDVRQQRGAYVDHAEHPERPEMQAHAEPR